MSSAGESVDQDYATLTHADASSNEDVCFLLGSLDDGRLIAPQDVKKNSGIVLVNFQNQQIR